MDRTYNEQGYGFEINKMLTEYAQVTQIKHGMTLPSLGSNIVVLSVFNKEADRPVAYLLFDTDIQKPIDDAFGLEDMAVCIEKHKLAKQI